MSFAELSIEELLYRLSAREPAPGGGTAAAAAVAMGAALCAMAGRFSPQFLERWPESVAEAEGRRDRALELAENDAEAYAGVLDARRSPPGPAKDELVAGALSRAADVPLELARLGLGVVEAARALSREGNRNLRGDALTAASLGAAGVRAAAELVRINLAASPSDERLSLARELDERAAAAAAQAFDGDGPAGGGQVVPPAIESNESEPDSDREERAPWT